MTINLVFDEEEEQYIAYIGDKPGVPVGKTFSQALANLGWKHSGAKIKVTH